MNRKQIIAELRRAAARSHSYGVRDAAFVELQKFVGYGFGEFVADVSEEHRRTFYLLVACALEDEQ